MVFLLVTGALAFYVAWNLGANDVANSMGTSVGSKVVTLRQAVGIAGVLELVGSVLFGHSVSSTLAQEIVDPSLFAADPHLFSLGMIAALLTSGLGLQLATTFGLPVSSSHAVVGAIAGFGWVAMGSRAVNWHSIGVISLTWVATPVISGAIAALFYSLVRRWILDQPNPIQQLYEWIPWLSTALVSVFGLIVFPSLPFAFLSPYLSLPSHDIPLAIGAIAAVSLTVVNWRSLATEQPTTEPENQAPTQRFQSPLERLMARFQLLSACFVAFAHGSNDVGNAIAPLAAIAYVQRTQTVPLDDFPIPTWILVVGGLGIVSGLAVFGKNVIQTIGENITDLQPSSGFCAELATATITLLASRLGLPVSTSHALVGAVVGIGLVRRHASSEAAVVQFNTLYRIALAWIITLPFATALSMLIFTVIRQQLGSTD